MTDIQELKRLAEAANNPMSKHGSLMAKQDANYDFHKAASPAAILSLFDRIREQEEVIKFARILVKQKGRHNTEIAYNRLVEELALHEVAQQDKGKETVCAHKFVEDEDHRGYASCQKCMAVKTLER